MLNMQGHIQEDACNDDHDYYGNEISPVFSLLLLCCLLRPLLTRFLLDLRFCSLQSDFLQPLRLL